MIGRNPLVVARCALFCIVICMIACLCMHTPLEGQSSKGSPNVNLQDLEKQLPNAEAAKKTELYIALIKGYMETSPRQALDWAQKAYAHSTDIEDRPNELRFLNYLCWLNQKLSNNRLAFSFGNKAILLAKELEAQQPLADAYFGTAVCYWQLSEYNSALEFHQKALAIRSRLGNKFKIYESHSNIGLVYQTLGIFDLALEYYLKALEVQEKLNPEGKDLANTLNKVGVIYYNLSDKVRALEYYGKALKLQEKKKDLRGIADSVNNIAVIYQEAKEYKHALEGYQRSLKIERQLANTKGIAMSLNNIGEVYLHTGKYQKANETLSRSIKLAEEVGDRYGVAYTLNVIAALNRKTGNYTKALKSSGEALEIAFEIRAKGLRRDVYKELVEIHSTMNNYREAYQTHKKLKIIDDELFHRNNRQKIVELQTHYDFRQKEKEIELLQRDKALQLLKFKKQGVYKKWLLISIVLAGLLLLVLLSRFRLKSGTNKIIRRQNDELAQLRKKLDRLTRNDPLTHLANRKDLMEKIELEYVRFERSGNHFTLLLADVDNFKGLNDRFGHECGDYVLVTLGKLFGEVMRKQDSVARWGGEEFLFLLPETNLEGGRILAEKIREKVANHVFEFEDETFFITITLGLSSCDDHHVDDCIKCADHALYRGKREGKNRVCLP